ncbi:MAG: PQQ-binding-like beta-propeller repeat protein [Phycisphaerales bacterium]|nr:MAG: PQQ-binding-like beta-propeller repeat protein [Phycisphaerales bacterium]
MLRDNTWMRQRGYRWAVALGCILLVCGARAENWPRFRGPNGQGLSEAQGIPTKWSEQDYNWKITLPGTGHSSPVIWDGKIFVTCADETSRRGFLLCLDGASGKELWRREQDLAKYPINRLNSYASPTPAVDADHVYVLWPASDETTLAAVTHGGEDVWAVKLDGVHARHGKGSSPIVYGDYVIVSHEQEKNNEGAKSQWVAFARKTGEVQWRMEEPPVSNASYSTPCIRRDGASGAEVVFASNAHGITGVDLKTGRIVWNVDGVLPDRVVSSPVLAGEMILATCGAGGRGKRFTAVRAAQSRAAAEVYHLETRVVPYVPTSVVYEGWVFAFHDSGLVSCLARDSGEVLWSEKPAGRFFGSPICVSGILYAVTVDGAVVVLRAGPAYELLGINPLGETSHSTAAVGGGRLVLRTISHVFSIGSGAQ